jgi:DNA-directed RNA polymerase subunit RPC12/RpoP
VIPFPSNPMLRVSNPEAVSRMPKCPACGKRVEYLRINLKDPFPCPLCGRKLMVSASYFKRLRYFCLTLAAVVAFTVAHRHLAAGSRTDPVLVFLLTSFVALSIVTVLSTILVKRIFPPQLEDYEEYSKQAHYTPL